MCLFRIPRPTCGVAWPNSGMPAAGDLRLGRWPAIAVAAASQICAERNCAGIDAHLDKAKTQTPGWQAERCPGSAVPRNPVRGLGSAHRRFRSILRFLSPGRWHAAISSMVLLGFNRTIVAKLRLTTSHSAIQKRTDFSRPIVSMSSISTPHLSTETSIGEQGYQVNVHPLP